MDHDTAYKVVNESEGYSMKSWVNHDSSRRVVIADDHPLVAHALALVIARKVPATIHLSSIDELSSVAERHKPNIVVAAFSRPEHEMFELLCRIRNDLAQVAMLLLTHDRSLRLAASALRCGARGVLSKTASGDELCVAIDVLLSGGYYIPPEVASGVRSGALQELLTPREALIARCVLKGMNAKAIAATTGTSTRTVETHLSAIRQKLGARSTVALARQLQEFIWI